MKIINDGGQPRYNINYDLNIFNNEINNGTRILENVLTNNSLG